MQRQTLIFHRFLGGLGGAEYFHAMAFFLQKLRQIENGLFQSRGVFAQGVGAEEGNVHGGVFFLFVCVESFVSLVYFVWGDGF